MQVANFPYAGGITESFRSLLYLHRIRENNRSIIKSWSGPAGIEEYLLSDEKGRLVQSLKSFLTSRSLQTTEVFGRRFKLEELIARILGDIRIAAETQFGSAAKRVVVGRPVRFVGAESDADDDYGLGRLKEALLIAGFEDVTFEYEPVGAAYHYESTLDHDELVMIGDFGGGTSDFSLVRVGRSLRLSGVTRRVIGNEGVGVAGDSFDARIIRHLVSPALGASSEIESGGKRLPVPNWVYFKLERWHHLSFLKSADTLNMLRSVAAQALQPRKTPLFSISFSTTSDISSIVRYKPQKSRYPRPSARACISLTETPRSKRSLLAPNLRVGSRTNLGIYRIMSTHC